MILDKVENLHRYEILLKGYGVLKEFLGNFDLENFQTGKFSIKENILWGIGLTYQTKNEDECVWEAHNKHIDVHYVLEGEETIYLSDRSFMNVLKPYDSENDYSLFEGEKSDIITLKEGMILFLFPNEVHKTGIKNTESKFVKKIVFKLNEDAQ